MSGLWYPRESPCAAIQEAVYARLSGDEQLAAMVKGVFDEVPEQVVYPYVTVGEAVETPFDTHDCYGAKVDTANHIWSDYRGYLQGNRIAGQIVALLARQPLDVDGHRVVTVKHRQTTPMRDPNPRLRHVVVRFQIITEQHSPRSST